MGRSPTRAQHQEFAEKVGTFGAPNVADNRRLEVVVDGFPLFGGVQLAVDMTLVSAVQGDGVPRRGRDGVALASARWKKARTCPEFVAAGAQARLVLALEVGGRWSQEANTCVKLLPLLHVLLQVLFLELRGRQDLIRTRLSAIFTMRASV